MLTQDRKATAGYLVNTPLQGTYPRYKPHDSQDFGYPASVHYQLRRRHKSLPDFGERDFGIYLGKHDGKYVVAIKDFETWQPTDCEVFDSLDELKGEWELD